MAPSMAMAHPSPLVDRHADHSSSSTCSLQSAPLLTCQSSKLTCELHTGAAQPPSPRSCTTLHERFRPGSHSSQVQIIPKPKEIWRQLTELFEDHDILGCGSRLGYQQTQCINSMRYGVFAAGETLMKAGSLSPEPRLFIIIRGRCAVCDGLQEARVLGPNEHFGDQEVMAGITPQVTVKVLEGEPLEAYYLDRSMYRRILVQLPEPLRLRCQLIKSFIPLQWLTGKEIAQLGQALQPVVFLEGEHLWNEGDKVDTMYFLVEGKVAMMVTDGRTQRPLYCCGSGHWVGELELRSKMPAVLSAVAVQDTRCLMLCKPHIQRVPATFWAMLDAEVAKHQFEDYYSCRRFLGLQLDLFQFGDDTADAALGWPLMQQEERELGPPPRKLHIQRRFAISGPSSFPSGSLEPQVAPRNTYDAARLRQVLASHPLFLHHDVAERRWLGDIMQENHYPPGALIISPCDEGHGHNAFHVLVEGKCALFHGTAQHGVLEAPGCFGAECLVTAKSQATTVRALTTVRTMSIDADTYYHGVISLRQRRVDQFTDLLQATQFLKPVPSNLLIPLLERCKTERWIAGDHIIRCGDSANTLLLLAEGDVLVTGSDGERVVSAGGSLGDAALLVGDHSMLDISVLQNSRTLCLAMGDLEELLSPIELWIAEDYLPVFEDFNSSMESSSSACTPHSARSSSLTRTWPTVKQKRSMSSVHWGRPRALFEFGGRRSASSCPATPKRCATQRRSLLWQLPELVPNKLTLTTCLTCPAVQLRTKKYRPMRTQHLASVTTAATSKDTTATAAFQDTETLGWPSAGCKARRRWSVTAKQRQWLLRVFQEQAVFGLDEGDVEVMENIIRKMAHVRFRQGQTLFRPHKCVRDDDKMYVISVGECTLSMNQEVLGIFGTQDLIGEVELMHCLPLKCTAVVHTPTLEAFVLNRASYLQALGSRS